MIVICASVVAASCASPWVAPHAGEPDATRRLATIAPYPAGRADDVRRPGFNGRLWIGESNIGPVNTSWPLGWGDPGPAAYGGLDEEFTTVYARIGHLVTGISPWLAIREPGLADFELARNQWLKEEGFIGGVRTFVNDAYLDRWSAHAAPTVAPADLLTSALDTGRAGFKTPEPRATITIPDDAVRMKSRQRVHNDKPARVVAPDAKLASAPDAGRARSSVRFAVVEAARPATPKAAAQTEGARAEKHADAHRSERAADGAKAAVGAATSAHEKLIARSDMPANK